MSKDTKTAGDAQATAALEAAPKKRKRKSSAKAAPPAPPEVPSVKVRLTSALDPKPEVEPEAATGPLSTQLIETIEGPMSPNGVVPARPGEVRPVKARLGDGYMAGHSESNGNGHISGSGNGAGNGYKARVSPFTGVEQAERATTSRLRDTDIAELRLKLKREEWISPRAARGAHGRALPYFLMRHRTMRARSQVGHARSQVARRRYGGAGPAVQIARVLLVLFLLTGLLAGAGMGGAVAAASWYINNKL